MGKYVIHRFNVDFETLKDGDVYQSLCGNRYTACGPPTAEEIAEISKRTKGSPVCKACTKLWARQARTADLARPTTRRKNPQGEE